MKDNKVIKAQDNDKSSPIPIPVGTLSVKIPPKLCLLLCSRVWLHVIFFPPPPSLCVYLCTTMYPMCTPRKPLSNWATTATAARLRRLRQWIYFVHGKKGSSTSTAGKSEAGGGRRIAWWKFFSLTTTMDDFFFFLAWLWFFVLPLCLSLPFRAAAGWWPDGPVWC